MPDLRENQNPRPISTRNGNHEAINDIQSFMRNVSCFIAYKPVGRNSAAYSASFVSYTCGAIRFAIARYGPTALELEAKRSNRSSVNAALHRLNAD
jgi:hypothetical protein